jgi:hypothetical protein
MCALFFFVMGAGFLYFNSFNLLLAPMIAPVSTGQVSLSAIASDRGQLVGLSWARAVKRSHQLLPTL